MKAFMDDNFLLQTPTAQTLFHEYAADMPIIDYHCHIPAKEIAEDRRFDNITQVWLAGDHYKWRLIRSNGVPEEEITGNADDRTKFQRFAEALPRAIGNPMYHWTHLELQRYFGYHGVLNGDTAEEVWNLCNDKLRNDPDMTVRGLIRMSNVDVIGTTDAPSYSLRHHRAIAEDKSMDFKVVPSFRLDKPLNVHKAGFGEYIAYFGNAVGMEIKCAEDVKKALLIAMDRFEAMGCKASDHGLDYMMFRLGSPETVETAFQKGIHGLPVTKEEQEVYQTEILTFAAREYARRGWAMQLHYNVQRNTCTQRLDTIGADAGCDTIGSWDCGVALTRFLDYMDKDGCLPKTIIYSLNPSENALIGSIIGSFQRDGVAGKIQHGSAWWFNDNKVGMEEQLTSLANLSILGNFIGMLTDSRSFLSYTRHEYFRRILCNLIGNWVENGEYPGDMQALGKMVQDISYNNAKAYFGF